MITPTNVMGNLAGLEPLVQNIHSEDEAGLPAASATLAARESRRPPMWFVPGVNLEAAASAEPAAPTLAQARIRSNQLNSCERDVIDDLFPVLESLVLRNALPAEAQGRYDQAVLMLAQRYD